MTTDQLQDAARLVGYALSVPLWALIGFNWFNRRRYFSSLVALVCIAQSLILMLLVILNKGMRVGPIQDMYTIIIVLLPIALLGYIYEHKFRARTLWLEDDDVLDTNKESPWRFLVSLNPWRRWSPD